MPVGGLMNNGNNKVTIKIMTRVVVIVHGVVEHSRA